MWGVGPVPPEGAEATCSRGANRAVAQGERVTLKAVAHTRSSAGSGPLCGLAIVSSFFLASRRRNAKCCEETRVPFLAARKCAKCHAGPTTFIWAAVLVCCGFREEEVMRLIRSEEERVWSKYVGRAHGILERRTGSATHNVAVLAAIAIYRNHSRSIELLGGMSQKLSLKWRWRGKARTVKHDPWASTSQVSPCPITPSPHTTGGTVVQSVVPHVAQPLPAFTMKPSVP